MHGARNERLAMRRPSGRRTSETARRWDGRPAHPSTAHASACVVRERDPEASGERPGPRVLGSGGTVLGPGFGSGGGRSRSRAARSDARCTQCSRAAPTRRGDPMARPARLRFRGSLPPGCRQTLAMRERRYAPAGARRVAVGFGRRRAARSTARFSSEGATVRESGNDVVFEQSDDNQTSPSFAADAKRCRTGICTSSGRLGSTARGGWWSEGQLASLARVSRSSDVDVP